MFVKIYLILILLLSFQAFASNNCAQLSRDEKPLLTLYTEHWPPYQNVDSNSQLSGISVDKIEEVLKAAKWPYEINVVPWARAIKEVKSTPNSFIFSLARFPERENTFQWIAPLAKVISKLHRFKNEKLIDINSLEDVKKYTVILKRGEASSTFFIENNLVNQDTIIWITESSQALKLLSIGRGDLYPETIHSFDEAIKSSAFEASQFSSVYDFKALDVTLYLAATAITNTELVNTLSLVFSCFNDSKEDR
jgi:polar amino acid transport system substrate-binding protein